jgi:hypothetical protein
MSMRSRAPLRSLLAVSALAVSGCAGGESTGETPPRPAPGPDDAAEQTIAAGPARIAATVRAERARYHLRGTWDPTGGYRVCAVIVQAPSADFEDRVLWLEGRNRSYGTLTGRACGRSRSWFDDHPPTLPLFGPFERPGAEDYLHAALLALGGLSERGLVDFGRFDRDPPRRDEDGWTLRPLLRELGTRRVDVQIDGSGFVERLRLVGPRDVAVSIRLAGFGSESRVRHVVAHAIE